MGCLHSRGGETFSDRETHGARGRTEGNRSSGRERGDLAYGGDVRIQRDRPRQAENRLPGIYEHQQEMLNINRRDDLSADERATLSLAYGDAYRSQAERPTRTPEAPTYQEESFPARGREFDNYGLGFDRDRSIHRAR